MKKSLITPTVKEAIIRNFGYEIGWWESCFEDYEEDVRRYREARKTDPKAKVWCGNKMMSLIAMNKRINKTKQDIKELKAFLKSIEK